jgi:L-ascorbate metabolism protein UlaG (beta-lactamase superfamily)
VGIPAKVGEHGEGCEEGKDGTWYLTFMIKLIPAFQKDDALLRDIAQAPNSETVFHTWWLGQSGFLIKWNGHLLLLDPYLSDSLSTKYASTKKPHARMSELVIPAARLKGLEIVTSSHNHTDHLDAETLIPILKNNPGIRFLIPESNRDFVAGRMKCDVSLPIGITDGQERNIGPFTFHGIPAKHEEIEYDDNGNCIYMGYVIRFGPWTVYHSGDTLWFDEMVNLLKPFAPDLALLPINGSDPVREVAGNLNGAEAVRLAREIGAKITIPCHYDMFEFNTADVKDFENEARKANVGYKVLRGGERFTMGE